MSEEPNATMKPPYLAYTTFKNFLKGMKAGVVPSRIDKSMMPGQSGATQSYLLSALKFFQLIDKQGVPQPSLHSLIEGDDASQKSSWGDVFKAAYIPIIGDLNLERATEGQLNEKFQAQGLGGETVRKCFAFFVAGAEAAGIPLAPHLKPNTRSSGPRKARRAKTTKNGNGAPANVLPEVITPHTRVGHNVATLPLNADNTRHVRFEAPATITSAELKRIQAWLGFQLIVEDAE